jgi:hypothetical protein
MPWVIADWDKHFEYADSRKLVQLHWLRFRTRHDGQGFQRLIRKANGVELFGAFILIAQVASKMENRGVLANEHGDLDAEDIGIMCGAPTETIEQALAVLSEPKIGWLFWRSPNEPPKSPGLVPKSPDEPPKSPGLKNTYKQTDRQNKTVQAGGEIGRFEVDCERFVAEYPKTVSDWDMQILLSEVRTQADQEMLFSNLELYRTTDQWQRGIVPAAENWLKKGFWKKAPKVFRAQPEETPISDPRSILPPDHNPAPAAVTEELSAKLRVRLQELRQAREAGRN